MVGSYYYSDRYGNYNSTIKGKWGLENHLYGEGGNDLIKGGEYNDWLYGDDGNDTLYGYAGNDSLYGGAGVDSVYGGAGDDYIDGGEGGDFLYGGDGNDTVIAGMGDYVALNAGNDLALVENAMNVTVVGGVGNDRISVSGDSSGNFQGNDGADAIFIGMGRTAATVYGGNGDDTVISDAKGGAIYGEGGNDVIEASLADRVYGGAGNDRIVIGSYEQRELGKFSGGADSDTFEFHVMMQEATITDFVHGQDKIDLSYLNGINGMQDINLLVINGDTLVDHYDRVTNQTFELWLDNVTHVAADDFIF